MITKVVIVGNQFYNNNSTTSANNGGIGRCVFYGLTNLVEVDATNSNIQRIYSHAFYGCENLRFIYLPDTVLRFGYDVLDDCPSLESIHFPDSLVSWQDMSDEWTEYYRGYDVVVYGSGDDRTYVRVLASDFTVVFDSEPAAGWDSIHSQFIVDSNDKDDDDTTKEVSTFTLNEDNSVTFTYVITGETPETGRTYSTGGETVTPTPVTGYQFIEWQIQKVITDDDGNVTYEDVEVTSGTPVEIDSNLLITAVFDYCKVTAYQGEQTTLTITANNQSYPGNGTWSFAVGTEIVITYRLTPGIRTV